MIGKQDPPHFSLPDCYWDVLFAMAQLEGMTVVELATERLKQIIIEDAVLDTEHIEELISKGVEKTLKDDPYFKNITERDD